MTKFRINSYEFTARGTYVPSKNMEYNKNFDLPTGSFTDDTSMMLCLAESLTEREEFDPADQMEKYEMWYKHGYMSVDVERGCFDIGRTTRQAINSYIAFDKTSKRKMFYGLSSEYDSGNGGIMRLAPVPIRYWNDHIQAAKYSMLSSQVTHASTECLESAALMGVIISQLLQGKSKEQVLDQHMLPELLGFRSRKVKDIADRSYIEKSINDIKSTGYVIDSLEAALWAFSCTYTFELGMITCAGLGGDVDTICCIYGQIAGAYYGYKEIPQRWLDAMQRKDLLSTLFGNLVAKVISKSDAIMSKRDLSICSNNVSNNTDVSENGMEERKKKRKRTLQDSNIDHLNYTDMIEMMDI